MKSLIPMASATWGKQRRSEVNCKLKFAAVVSVQHWGLDRHPEFETAWGGS